MSFNYRKDNEMKLNDIRAQWLTSPPSAKAPWYAFRSVSHRWVTLNPRSRENQMRNILERIFNNTFVHTRPSFLRNPETKRCLELDAYCEKLKIGCEFNGIQHQEYPNPFHSSRAQFEKQRQRDMLKIDLCKAHGVKLVTVPHTIQHNELEQYLRDQLHDQIAKTAALGYICALETEAEVLASFAAIEIACHN